ncbi:hypothetical protein D3C78_1426890 [compost metagenome]
MATVNVRRPSPLQRRVLIVLAALEAKRPGPVATKDIERLLAQGGDAPVYGNNLRGSCRCWLTNWRPRANTSAGTTCVCCRYARPTPWPTRNW